MSHATTSSLRPPKLFRSMMSVEELLAFCPSNNLGRDLRQRHYRGVYCRQSPVNASHTHAPTPQECWAALRTQVNLPQDVTHAIKLQTTPACEDGEECCFAHTAEEMLFHPDNYKRHRCSDAGHISKYPAYVQMEMGLHPGTCISDTEEATRPDADDDSVRFCPFYHSFSERDSWDSWRLAFSDFHPWNSAELTVRHCRDALGSMDWYQRLRVACQRCRTKILDDARDVWSTNPSGVVIVQELDVLCVASEMRETTTHASLCYLMFAEYAIEGFRLIWPSDSRSIRLVVDRVAYWPIQELCEGFGCANVDALAKCGRVVVVDPLSGSVNADLSTAHRVALAEWIQTAHQLAVASSKPLIPLQFFPHCTSNPCESDNPHYYYSYLALVGDLLEKGYHSPHGYLPPLEFCQRSARPVLLGIAHWLCTDVQWIKKRDAVASSISEFLTSPT